MTLQTETRAACNKLGATSYGTVAYAEMQQGRAHKEPLFFAMDGAIRYAKAYKARFEQPVKEDYVLGPEFLSWITGLRGLLNGMGAVAMERGSTRDSKDNGTLEAMFWAAMEIGGFTEEDL